MKTMVSEKGQVTIPKALRDRLGIRPGQVLHVREERGRLIVTKHTEGDPIESVVGVLKGGARANALLAELRGEPDEP
jgi:antitoxin PrlF